MLLSRGAGKINAITAVLCSDGAVMKAVRVVEASGLGFPKPPGNFEQALLKTRGTFIPVSLSCVWKSRPGFALMAKKSCFLASARLKGYWEEESRGWMYCLARGWCALGASPKPLCTSSVSSRASLCPLACNKLCSVFHLRSRRAACSTHCLESCCLQDKASFCPLAFWRLL